MTGEIRENTTNVDKKSAKKTFEKVSFKAFGISLLFILSSIGAPVLINPAGAFPNSSGAALAAPLSALEANWMYSDGNQFAQNYSPQKVINSSNAQYLGINWLFPIPSQPDSLIGATPGIGVDTTPLIINGTIYAVAQYGQIFALNAANGNQLWTTTIPLTINATTGLGVAGKIRLHLHQGEQAFTTRNFGWNSGGTGTYWISVGDFKIYALNAQSGKYQMNFSYYTGLKGIDGNSPTSLYAGSPNNILIDEKRGILVTSMHSTSQANAARCFFRGFNILVNPPQLLWTSYCSPPQPHSNVPLDPLWSINNVNSMIGAQIFYPGPDHKEGFVPASGVVDLKTLTAAQLNATLYDDWGQVNQSAFCQQVTGGMSTGAVGDGWGGAWIVDQKTGAAFVNTGNRGPYAGPCNPGPDLWQASVMAINDTNGKWIWGFMTSPHDNWDWDCSWFQALGNETVNGVSTQVLWKTCKNGYLHELNAANGKMIWSWSPPPSILTRAKYSQIQNPLNRTEMTNSCPGSTSLLGPWPDFFSNPSFIAGFESTAAYNPQTNMIYLVSHNVPSVLHCVPMNATNYATSQGVTQPGGYPDPKYGANATAEAVDAATGQMVWAHNVEPTGFRGGIMTSGNVLYLPLASGDLLMLNAQTGATIKDLFTGAPMGVVPSIGATAAGQEELILAVGVARFFGNTVPGDIVALILQNVPAGTTNTVTATTTAPGQTITTTVGGQTVTVTGSQTTVTAPGGGVSSTLLYGVAAIAVVLAISTGYLAMRGRKPTP